MNAKEQVQQERLFSIGTTARLTGISSAALRAWEKRYGLQPSRRDTAGRRLYDRDTLQKLMLIKALLDKGMRIGDLADKTVATLKPLVAELQRNDHREHCETPHRLQQLIDTLQQIELADCPLEIVRYCRDARCLLQRALQKHDQACSSLV